jgi:hypothetical protein
MSYLIEKIKKDLAANNLEIRTRESRNWLKTHLANIRVNRPRFIKDKDNKFVRVIFPGKMYFYFYDPKLKDELPFYDRFPLVIPIKRYNDGFLGINLHYLPPKIRIILLDKLYAVLNNERYDESTKLRLSYNLLDGTQRFKEFRPCLKRYLTKHIESRIVEIPFNDWEIVSFLPSEYFVGARKATVQRESMQQILNLSKDPYKEEKQNDF